MCGIVGVFSSHPDFDLSEPELCAMRDRMEHRGPDSAGIFMERTGAALVGLGHRRLSILDLSSAGHQPMSTADGRLWVVFNGEIFNFMELRQDLERGHGCLFRSHSDTEVLLSAIQAWGLTETLRRIRGMYAFALYDRADSSLTLVRDPLGVKPLYYLQTGKCLVFASEIKAILAMPGFRPELEEQSLFHYLTFANAPAPATFFQGISKLEAGCLLRVVPGSAGKPVRHWDPCAYTSEGFTLSEEECAEELRRLLRQAVARRMVSDVPFGVFLSGGVDSSLNVALMAELMDRPVETFCVGMEGSPSNEFNFAREVAARFGANHHETMVSDDQFLSFLPRMPFYQDEPLADPVCVPLHYVSKLARDSGTIVIQVGEGSDELFAGYPMFHYLLEKDRKVFQPFLQLPGMLRTALSGLLGPLVAPEFQDSLRRGAAGEPFYLGNAIAFWDAEKRNLLNRVGSMASSGSYIQGLGLAGRTADPMLQIIQTELKNRLPELLLMRVDKMSMISSIETRVPFLDEDVVMFALQIPSRLKYRNREPKYILKKAAEGILPNEVIYRKKMGFCGSAATMMSDRVAAYAKDVVMESPLSRSHFNRPYLESLFSAPRERQRGLPFRLWNLMNLVLWYDVFFPSQLIPPGVMPGAQGRC